jgi:hypothetical protein
MGAEIVARSLKPSTKGQEDSAMKRYLFGPVLLLAGCATDGTAGQTAESAVPFVSSTGVIEWRVNDERSLYVRAVTNQWYLVRTMGQCRRLQTATALGFLTARGTDELDRSGAILAEGQRCPIESVTRSAPPPAALPG